MRESRLSGARRERIEASPQFADGRFHNAAPSTGVATPSFRTMWDFFFKRGRRVPRGPIPLVSPLEAWARPSEKLRATWLGHSTVLIELAGRRVLTDPVFGERASPLGLMGPRRFHAPPVPVEALPDLDLVVLSHDHYDHLCNTTLRALAKRRVPIVTALGVGARLERLGWDPGLITELDWQEHMELGPLRVTATPAQHFSGRGVSDRNRTLWSSFVIESADERVFFSGDSGFTEAFGEIGQRHGPFDLVMIEVGAFHPNWAAIHMGPENALKVQALLRGELLLPIHWSTFNLALHDWDEPAEVLMREAAGAGRRVATPLIGEPFSPRRVERMTPWWRAVDAVEVPLAAVEAQNSGT
ncbi:MAG TPA: MBL fold metallo-hydrolase [Myxococcota bacterium]|nr:MBL fold metallo-hydrolase [Myxococcota bacterium]